MSQCSDVGSPENPGPGCAYGQKTSMSEREREGVGGREREWEGRREEGSEEKSQRERVKERRREEEREGVRKRGRKRERERRGKNGRKKEGIGEKERMEERPVWGQTSTLCPAASAQGALSGQQHPRGISQGD